MPKGIQIFKPRSIAQTPSSALAKINQEFQLTAKHKDPIQAARSSLHLAFAHACGFGVSSDLSVFPAMVEKCAPNVLPITSALISLLNDPEWKAHRANSTMPYLRFIQRLLKSVTPMPRLDGVGIDSTY